MMTFDATAWHQGINEAADEARVPQYTGDCGYCGASCHRLRIKQSTGILACRVCFPGIDPDVGTPPCCEQVAT